MGPDNENYSIWSFIKDWFRSLWPESKVKNQNFIVSSSSQEQSSLTAVIQSGQHPQYPYLRRALEITGKFEGRGFDEVSGNFDGMGLSAGILQWCYGQGSLQNSILKPYQLLYGKIDEITSFGFPSPGIDITAGMSNQQAVRYCIEHMLIGTRVKSEWLSAWRRFLIHPTTIGIQERAADGVAQRAQQLCDQWQLKSERAFCFFFDVITQNGSMKSVIKSSPSRSRCFQYARRANSVNSRIWLPIIEVATDEMLTLFQASFERAIICRQAYVQDVFARKGTIALGHGFVHGEKWDLFGGSVLPPL